VLKVVDGCGDLDFATWVADGDDSGLEAVYRTLTGHLEKRGAVLLLERLLGRLDAAPAALAARGRALGSAAGAPPTFVDGRPCSDAGLAGLEVVAARPASADAAETVSFRGRPCGRLVHAADADYLGLGDVARLLESRPARPEEETTAAIELVAEVLSSLGWSYRDVQRTWFFLDHLLDWYGPFNDARNLAYTRLGVLGADRNVTIPASTGIEGRGLAGGHVVLDVLACRPRAGRPFAVRRMVNPLQNEAPEYGSSFSRGLALDTGSCRCLLVSGTASIDGQGQTVHVASFDRQAELTLDMVESLLRASGARLADTCQATAYLKHPGDLVTLRQILARRGLDRSPLVFVNADVCRPELLFELELTAMTTAG